MSIRFDFTTLATTTAIVWLTLVTSSRLVVDAAGQDSSTRPVVRVTTVVEIPYVMLKKDASKPPKNDDFEGFIPEVLQHLSSDAKFDYEIHLVADGRYGQKESSGSWTGMIGELVNDRADLAAAAITMSDARREVVDFTEPFMKFDTEILMKKPAPGNSSTPKIESLADLEAQNVVSYGAIRHGVTETYFRKPEYHKLWAHMSAGSGTGVTSAAEGVERVRKGFQKPDGTVVPFAFITEGSSAKYYVNTVPCDLYSVPLKMEPRGYALATKKNWALATSINNTMLKLSSNGQLESMRRKWWSGTCSGGFRHSGFGALVLSSIAALSLLMTSLPSAAV